MTTDPSKTALVVVDMQNFFLDASCMEHPNGLKAVEPTGRVVEWCREVGVKVCCEFSWYFDLVSIQPEIRMSVRKSLYFPHSYY